MQCDVICGTVIFWRSVFRLSRSAAPQWFKSFVFKIQSDRSSQMCSYVVFESNAKFSQDVNGLLNRRAGTASPVIFQDGALHG